MEDRDVETEENATLKLVASAYGVAIKPERFSDLLAAWDAWSDSILRNEGLAYREISGVFQEALLASERLNTAQEEKNLLDQVASPTILLDKEHAIVAFNESTRALLNEEGMDCAAFMATSSKPFVTLPETARRAYRMTGPGTRRSFLAVETPLGQNLKSAYPLAETVVRLSSIDWTPAFADDLAENLSLSAAEARVARGLLEGRTAQEIAGHLGRSVATIRSHIKVLLKKTGARRQTELVQFLTILRQVAEARPKPQIRTATDAGFEVRDFTRDTGMLRTVQYGAGHSALYFTTSSRPQENTAVRDAFTDAGLRIIAPCRPGFGGSDPAYGDSSDTLRAAWLNDLREACEARPIIMGHREGGILAAKAAAQLLAEGHEIAGLVLISTGAPVRDLRAFEAAAPSIRRSFLAAHSATAALRLGYRSAAHLFRSGRIGEDLIIDFFVRDSPADASALADPILRETLRGNLNYCFDDTDQIVRDVATWGQDWSATLAQVASAVPVTFIHGTENTVQDITSLRVLCAEIPGITLHEIVDQGQLALYQSPGRIAAWIAEIA